MEKDKRRNTDEVKRKKKVPTDVWIDDLDDDISPPVRRKKRMRPQAGADQILESSETEAQSEHARERPVPKRVPKRPVPKRPQVPKRQKEHAQKRRKEWSKKFFKRFLIVLSILAVMALIFIFAFRINNINVYGNTRYSQEEILNLIQYDEQPQNTILFYLKNRNLKVENIPFIDSIHIDMGGRDTINIEVVEKLTIGCIEKEGQYVYFDTDGIICEVSDSRQEDVPLIEGLTFESLELNTGLSVEDKSIYDALLNLTLLLDKHELTINKVMFKDDGSMSMQMAEIKVMLGTARNIEDKISELVNLLPQLENLKGTLHLENYDSTKDSIIFSKES